MIAKVNVIENGDYAPASDSSHWWRRYSWSEWSLHVNAVGRITWKISLAPGESAALGYSWHYFWQ